MSKTLTINEKYMRMAIALARKGIGKTSPNPAVGALVVKNGKIISRAYHKKAGEPHAEALAIERAGSKAKGATLYATLEACTHFGKTPPCVDKIIACGIKRAVFGMRDPNPVNFGRGIAMLRKAGITTLCGVLRKEVTQLNRPFIKFMTEHLPYITVKVAQSIDGKIADTSGNSRWISSPASRNAVQRLRMRHDAIMVGINTLLEDNPRLSVRSRRCDKQPYRIILDSDLRTPLSSRIFRHHGGDIIIIGGTGASQKRMMMLKKRGASVILVPRKKGHVDIVYAVKDLAKKGIMSILCEGGGELISSLLKERLVDEVYIFISPRFVGGRTAASSCGGDYSDIRKSFNLKDVVATKSGTDLLIKGRL